MPPPHSSPVNTSRRVVNLEREDALLPHAIPRTSHHEAVSSLTSCMKNNSSPAKSRFEVVRLVLFSPYYLLKWIVCTVPPAPYYFLKWLFYKLFIRKKEQVALPKIETIDERVEQKSGIAILEEKAKEENALRATDIPIERARQQSPIELPQMERRGEQIFENKDEECETIEGESIASLPKWIQGQTREKQRNYVIKCRAWRKAKEAKDAQMEQEEAEQAERFKAEEIALLKELDDAFKAMNEKKVHTISSKIIALREQKNSTAEAAFRGALRQLNRAIRGGKTEHAERILQKILQPTESIIDPRRSDFEELLELAIRYQHSSSLIIELMRLGGVDGLMVALSELPVYLPHFTSLWKGLLEDVMIALIPPPTDRATINKKSMIEDKAGEKLKKAIQNGDPLLVQEIVKKTELERVALDAVFDFAYRYDNIEILRALVGTQKLPKEILLQAVLMAAFLGDLNTFTILEDELSSKRLWNDLVVTEAFRWAVAGEYRRISDKKRTSGRTNDEEMLFKEEHGSFLISAFLLKKHGEGISLEAIADGLNTMIGSGYPQNCMGIQLILTHRNQQSNALLSVKSACLGNAQENLYRAINALMVNVGKALPSPLEINDWLSKMVTSRSTFSFAKQGHKILGHAIFGNVYEEPKRLIEGAVAAYLLIEQIGSSPLVEDNASV
jgi:hypothetical protein